jgi:O6-methylguanine-DNA--protein-cysteine methyltransferase
LANGRNPIGIIVPCHRVIGAKWQPHRVRRWAGTNRILLELERGQTRS